MKTALERDVRLVRFEDGKLEIALEPSARKTLVQRPVAQADRVDRQRWMVVVSAEQGAPTVQLAERRRKKTELEQGVRADPLVQAVLDALSRRRDRRRARGATMRRQTPLGATSRRRTRTITARRYRR